MPRQHYIHVLVSNWRSMQLQGGRPKLRFFPPPPPPDRSVYRRLILITDRNNTAATESVMLPHVRPKSFSHLGQSINIDRVASNGRFCQLQWDWLSKSVCTLQYLIHEQCWQPKWTSLWCSLYLKVLHFAISIIATRKLLISLQYDYVSRRPT